MTIVFRWDQDEFHLDLSLLGSSPGLGEDRILHVSVFQQVRLLCCVRHLVK